MSQVKLLKEVGGHVHTLDIDIHEWNGWKVRVRGYDGQSPMPSIFEMRPTTKAKSRELWEQAVAEYRAKGYVAKLDAKAAAKVRERRDAVAAAESAVEASLAKRLAAFPKSEQDRLLARAIAKPAKVKTLDLRGKGKSRLTVIPPEVKKLTALEVLLADGNALPELPEELGMLPALRELHLWNNALVEVPGTVRTMKTLELLDVTNNRLERVFWRPKVKARYYAGGNALKKAYQGSFTYAAFGFLPQFTHLSIDTTCIFPLDLDELTGDYGVRTKSFPTKSLVLSGRKPTAAESKALAKYFPKATIEHRAKAEPAPKP